MNDVIAIDRLTKYYGRREIVRDLSLHVQPGTIYGFLGRNGVGKTTTIRTLLGFETPTRGSTKILGEDSRFLTPQTRARIGYLPEGHHVYRWMSVAECGRFQASFYPDWNHDIFESVISHFRLNPKTKAKHLSRGQRAGLCLALALAPEPEVLVFDDPALGLDPVARRSLLQSMLYITRRPDRTILFSSHLLSDVERVADRIAILNGTRLCVDCTVDYFREHMQRYVLTFSSRPPTAPEIDSLLESFRTDRELHVTFANPGPDVMEKLEALKPDSIEPVGLSLEDAFISYVGERDEKTFFTKQEAAA